MMKFLTNSGTSDQRGQHHREVPSPSVMARWRNGLDGRGFGDDGFAALMIKLASRWACRTGPPV